MRVTVLIPSLNEIHGIEETLRSVPFEAMTTAGFPASVFVIDGASTDGTPEAARRLGATVITEPRKGYGRAYKTGFAKAPGDLIVTGDADGTYPFDSLPDLLKEFQAEALDFATVNRFARMREGSMSRKHKFGNRVLTLTTRALYGVKIKDSQSGMWILNRAALDALPLESLPDGMAFSQEIKIHAFRDRGLRSKELAGGYYVRHGTPKLGSWRDGLGNLRRLVARRFRRVPSGKASR